MEGKRKEERNREKREPVEVEISSFKVKISILSLIYLMILVVWKEIVVWFSVLDYEEKKGVWIFHWSLILVDWGRVSVEIDLELLIRAWESRKKR